MNPLVTLPHPRVDRTVILVYKARKKLDSSETFADTDKPPGEHKEKNQNNLSKTLYALTSA